MNEWTVELMVTPPRKVGTLVAKVTITDMGAFNPAHPLWKKAVQLLEQQVQEKLL